MLPLAFLLVDVGLTGLKLKHYPEHVCRIVTVDPNLGMNKQFQRRILSLEHGIRPDEQVSRWQRRLNEIQRFFGDGCTLTRDVPGLFSTQTFTSVEINNFYMAETKYPWAHVPWSSDEVNQIY
ncbi:hypothetical protein [Novipirellula artificiosorum]|uniref:Uncharacterized protein n=1 Tax=Novipirellula artificiosorum TaxID=2528016 RepID=A0A5C6DVJ9_9BACT|nr:hypothetical protein [Novipirellula artificiosorum]TWU40642.1 hypothetical protein Poly41_14760 [Novipirellula artificiosorum]